MSAGTLRSVVSAARIVWQARGGIPEKEDPSPTSHRSSGMEANTTKDPVAKAVADIRKATDRLIGLLASADASVGLRAAAALREVDPPPIWRLASALVESRDRGLRARIIEVLVQLSETDKIVVLCALAWVLRAAKEPSTKMEVVNGMIALKTIYEEDQEPSQGAAPVPPGDGPHSGAQGSPSWGESSPMTAEPFSWPGAARPTR
jgi:hypothetical protein